MRGFAWPNRLTHHELMRVEIAAAVEVVQPRALAARDGHERQPLVMLHLRAGMPDGPQASGNPVLSAYLSIVDYLLRVQSLLHGTAGCARSRPLHTENAP